MIFYKIYSTFPFKSFIYATFRSLKKEPDTVCSTMLGSWNYKNKILFCLSNESYVCPLTQVLLELAKFDVILIRFC